MNFNVYSRNCPARAVLSHVTGRWGSLVLGALSQGEMRFNCLRRAVDGVSEKVLASVLSDLVEDGLVQRIDAGTNPPRVSYRLSESGERIGKKITELTHSIETELAKNLPARYLENSEKNTHPKQTQANPSTPRKPR